MLRLLKIRLEGEANGIVVDISLSPAPIEVVNVRYMFDMDMLSKLKRQCPVTLEVYFAKLYGYNRGMPISTPTVPDKGSLCRVHMLPILYWWLGTNRLPVGNISE
ncbi:hypothetical protein SDJN02_23259, partial [Cucurbita argyrosperma subsp. argyrosperma]